MSEMWQGQAKQSETEISQQQHKRQKERKRNRQRERERDRDSGTDMPQSATEAAAEKEGRSNDAGQRNDRSLHSK